MIQLTAAGRELLLRALSNTATINFLDVQFGNGSNAGTSASALNNPLLTIGISRMTIDNPFVTLYTVFQNNTLASGFRRTETGVRAEDPDHPGTALLFAYGYTAPESAEYIPADSEDGIESLYNIEVYIGDAENVTASISESVIYATKEELEALQSEVDNISKDSVGLGNVPNVSTNDQTPTYSEYTQANSFSNFTDEDSAPELIGTNTVMRLDYLVSGETASRFMSKLQAAVKMLIRHLTNYANPHVVTYKQTGAAAASHQHSANDISSGVLGVARGGTGNQDGTASKATKLATARTLKVNLESTSGASFDGTAAANIGVSGILPPLSGGTGLNSLDALKEVIGGGTKSARFVVGTSASGWTADDCDYLCDGTDDHVEINAALAALPSGGGCVVLLDGTYNLGGDITITKAKTELRGMGGVSIVSSTSSANNVVAFRVKVTASYCIVDGITITGPSSSSTYGDSDYASLVEVSNSDRTIITKNRIVRGTIKLTSCTNCLVDGNIVGQNNGYARGIESSDGEGNIFSNNNLTGAYFGLSIFRETKFVITGNVTTLQQEYGIGVWNGCKDFTISGNSIHTNRGGTSVGIRVQGSRNFTISGNSIGITDCDGYSYCMDILANKNFIITGNSMKNANVSGALRIYSTCENGLITANSVTCKNGSSMGVNIVSGAVNCLSSNNLVQAYDAEND